MTRRIRRTRSAITLIELLVVIAIIGILMSLLLAGVQNARDAGMRTDNYDRMAQVGTAIGIAKEKVHMPYVWSGNFWLKGRYNATDPELDILLQMFPHMNHAGNSVAPENNGYTGGDVLLDANQALVLLLTGGTPTNMTGFHVNPRKPFLTGGERKGPFLDPNPTWFAADLNNGHPRLIDRWGTYYIVFAATKGKPGAYLNCNDGTVQAVPISPNTPTIVTPFQSGGKYINEKGYQIISAGKDKLFGAGGTNFPVATNPGADDQANFSRSVLGSGLN